jgi:hypothetical protein
MDKKQKSEIVDRLLSLNLAETQAINRALKYYLKKFRGRYNAGQVNHYLKRMETVHKCLNGLNDVERKIVEVIMEGYDKGVLKAHPYMMVRSVDIHNGVYRFLTDRVSSEEIELLIGALAMYRATPGIAKKYKKECVELRLKIFGGVVND